MQANKQLLDFIVDEATNFIRKKAEKFINEGAKVAVCISGGKDSTVVTDLTIKALANPNLLHIFSDTTLEFLLTIEYAKRYRQANPKAIFRIKKRTFMRFVEKLGRQHVC